MKFNIKKWFPKKPKYLIYLVVGVLLIILFIISDNANRKHEFVFLTFPKNYSIVNQHEASTINLFLYAREKKTMYLDLECISQVYLVDNYTKDRYQLEQVEIIPSEKLYEHKNKRYFGYEIKAIFPFVFKGLMLIEDAYLDLFYHNGESLALRVGSFAIDQQSINSDVRITYLKGLTGVVGNHISLASIIVQITNDSKDSINLDNLQFISPYIRVNYDYVQSINEERAKSNILLKDILTDYDPSKASTKSHFDREIPSQSKICLLIPLSYRNNTFINEVAFKLNYYQEPQKLMSITSPSFRYFTTKVEIIPPEQLIYVRN